MGDLVSLLRKDARELDARLEAKREERGGLVPLYCCNRYLGQFMPSSRVRCPVCKVWRRPTA